MKDYTIYKSRTQFGTWYSGGLMVKFDRELGWTVRKGEMPGDRGAVIPYRNMPPDWPLFEGAVPTSGLLGGLL